MENRIEPGELGLCLVTGAAGLLGSNLVRKLLDEGCRVRALINRTPLKLEHENLECVQGNLCDQASLRAACQGVDTVFHTASAIALLGGFAMKKAYRAEAWRVNVDGTQSVIDLCKEEHVKRLIYTSSVDVCFEGKPLPAMREDLPYAKDVKCIYSETKVAAEKRVLAANGEGGLLTCAIRPDGIYGAEPNLIIDPVAKQLAAGNMKARIGDPSVLQDNSHVFNLVHGEILAACHLVPDGNACGQAYFIGDAEPMNSMEFFRPLIEGMDQPFPTTQVPEGLLRAVTATWEALHFLVGIPEPFLTPHEVDKVCVTHYGLVEKARRDLGYEPVISVKEAMVEIIAYCKARHDRAASAA
ncbi:MAG: NAD-dependent epimerase/dehydratase family protein [Myxococcota bacterium]